MSSKPNTDVSRNDIRLSESKDLFREQAVGRRSSSVENYCNGVNAFLQWAEEQGYSHTRDIDRMTVGGFYPWLDNEYSNSSTKAHYINGVRQWLKFLEKRGIIERGTTDIVETYTVPPEEKKWAKSISPERVDAILKHMEKQYPHHRDTTFILILAKTGMRTCGLHSIDCEDVRLDDQNRPEIRLRDRPETGTQLKRGKDKEYNHERNVPIEKELFDVIREYAKHHRHNVTDDYGRKPLITSENGRLSKSIIKDTVYKWTCPQHTGVGECDCGKKPNINEASKCEASISPHGLRGAAITKFRNAGNTWEDIGDLVGAKPDILQQHYDRGTKADKADRARTVLDTLE